MKFSPILPFALSTLITTSLAAPTELRQPAPASISRRSSDAAPIEELQAAQEKRQSADNFPLPSVFMGPGEDLKLVRKKRQAGNFKLSDYDFGSGNGGAHLGGGDKTKREEKRQSTADHFPLADNLMGSGDELELVKKRQSTADHFPLADNLMGSGDELELVKKRQSTADHFPLSDNLMGSGDDLELVRKAIEDSPIIRRKAEELSALIKERAAAPEPEDVAAPAA